MEKVLLSRVRGEREREGGLGFVESITRLKLRAGNMSEKIKRSEITETSLCLPAL